MKAETSDERETEQNKKRGHNPCIHEFITASHPYYNTITTKTFQRHDTQCRAQNLEKTFLDTVGFLVVCYSN